LAAAIELTAKTNGLVAFCSVEYGVSARANADLSVTAGKQAPANLFKPEQYSRTEPDIYRLQHTKKKANGRAKQFDGFQVLSRRRKEISASSCSIG